MINNFFDKFRGKMATLRPSEKHLEADWETLNVRLDAVLPPVKKERKRLLALPLILSGALLFSNAFWWQNNRELKQRLDQIEASQVVPVSPMASATPIPSPTVVHDTIWRTKLVYAAQPLIRQEVVALPPTSALTATIAVGSNAIERASASNSKDGLAQFEGQLPLSYAGIHLSDALLPLPQRKTFGLTPEKTHIKTPLKQLIDNNLSVKHQTRKARITNAISPRIVSVGASAGMLFASSKSLMHEGGFSFQMGGEIGFTRHLSATLTCEMGQIHYKTLDPSAILGAPTLPDLGADHRYSEMEVSGQKIGQFALGLRYAFGQITKPRPFVGLTWGGQKLHPFSIAYETQQESTGIFEKFNFDVTAPIKISNIVGLNAGIDIPLSQKLGLMLEGYYQRQWRKSNPTAPDFTGVRARLNWLF